MYNTKFVHCMPPLLNMCGRQDMLYSRIFVMPLFSDPSEKDLNYCRGQAEYENVQKN
jgi:hypothetical protein